MKSGAAFLLTAALAFSLEASAMSTKDAVERAHETVLPKKSDLFANPEETLSNLGGGETDLPQKSLYEGGQGSILGPNRNKVESCQKKNDPQCLAIQVVSRSEVQKPSIDKDILEAADEVVDSAQNEWDNTSNGLKPGECRPLTLGGTTIKEEQTCQKGGPLADLHCQKGYQFEGPVLESRWACVEKKDYQKKIDCLVPSEASESVSAKARCFYGDDALKEKETIEQKTNASIRATFIGECRAPQVIEKTLRCSNVLKPAVGPSCVLGTTSGVTVEGEVSLKEDPCPAMDRLTLEKTCAKESLSRQKLTVQVAGVQPIIFARKSESRLVKVGACSVKATGGTACTNFLCTSTVKVEVYHNGVHQGVMNARLFYERYHDKKVTDVWVNDCEGLVP